MDGPPKGRGSKPLMFWSERLREGGRHTRPPGMAVGVRDSGAVRIAPAAGVAVCKANNLGRVGLGSGGADGANGNGKRQYDSNQAFQCDLPFLKSAPKGFRPASANSVRHHEVQNVDRSTTGCPICQLNARGFFAHRILQRGFRGRMVPSLFMTCGA